MARIRPALFIGSPGLGSVAGASQDLRVIPDEDAEVDGDIRVIDESEEDYLYSADWFVFIELPQVLRRSLSRAA